MKIYFIQGTTGEYDSYRDWIVRAYKNFETALKDVELLNNFLINRGVHTSQYDRSNFNILDYEKTQSKINESLVELLFLDRKAELDYSGAEYQVLQVDYEEN